MQEDRTTTSVDGVQRGWCVGRALCALMVLALLAAGWAWYLHGRSYTHLGPLVQRMDTQGFSLVWWDTHAASADVHVRDQTGEHPVQITAQGDRWLARVDGLEPASVCTYDLVDRNAKGEMTFHESADVRTAPLPGASFSFAVVGDSGDGAVQTYRLAERMLAYHPGFVMHVGDVVYRTGAWADYPAHFFRPFLAVSRQIPIYPVLGNHDVVDAGGAAYLSVFDLPQNGPPGSDLSRCYVFDWAGASFVALDSTGDTDDVARVQVPWMEQALAGRPAGWRFAFFHHPPYSAGSHGPSPDLQRVLVPALERAGIDAVFCGHNHTYIRTAPLLDGSIAADGGIVYITSGEGGPERVHPFHDLPSYVEASNQGSVSFTLVEVESDQLSLRQIDANGRVLDQVRLARGQPEGLREVAGAGP